MRALLILVGLAALALVGAMSLGLITVKQTKTATLPEISFNGGSTPAFKADVANVSVGMENTTVAVPTVEMKQQTISVPSVKVTKPEGAPGNDSAPAKQ
jgi:hypothetical protein